MNQPLSVVFYWHMHQPFYRDAQGGDYQLPWVYLHAMKDYTDMAAILEQVAGARAVINYVPSLTLQIEDYATQLRAWLNGDQATLPDPLLGALAHTTGDYSDTERDYLMDSCFRLNHERNMHRYPAFNRLWDLAEHAKSHSATLYLGHHFYTDLVTWYHLGWLAETVREKNFVARRLIEKAENFNYQDRRDLLALIASLLNEIPEKHRSLQAQGKIEISTTPYAHPIVPLMLDFNSARETIPDALIPEQPYPDGSGRAKVHIEMAQGEHQRVFGQAAAGCWPAEGAVSEATLGLLGQAGFSWCATGEGVLRHSLDYSPRDGRLPALYQPWQVGDGAQKITCFFRDDRLSDLIGFEYSRWDTRDAVANFMQELMEVTHRCQDMENPVVSIIMDGENAWEHYHENGVPFLVKLYQSIIAHEDFHLTTFSDYLQNSPSTQSLQTLIPGSWVYGNLSTWIGDEAKTRAWELLIEAKRAYDEVIDSLSDDQQVIANEQLCICEGSDWCWWFGDQNPAAAVRDFDQLYRQHLKHLYAVLGLPAPSSLDENISSGGGSAEGGGVMRRGQSDT